MAQGRRRIRAASNDGNGQMIAMGRTMTAGNMALRWDNRGISLSLRQTMLGLGCYSLYINSLIVRSMSHT